MARFHEKSFDDATQLKLELFRGYVREWLPVFLTQYAGRRGQYEHVNIFDFFAGPGHDAAGHPGSPLIIVEELKQFCAGSNRASGIHIRMLFNDIDPAHIQKLRGEVAQIACGNGCCRTEFSVMPFLQALDANLPAMRDSNSANLVIMDQFGVKAARRHEINLVLARSVNCISRHSTWLQGVYVDLSIRRPHQCTGIGAPGDLLAEEPGRTP